MYSDFLKRQVNRFKNSEEGRRYMKRMLKDGILAMKDIARYSGLSLAQVKKLQASAAVAT